MPVGITVDLGTKTLELNSSSVTEPLSDFADKVKARFAKEELSLDEADTFVTSRFDSKEVAYLKAHAAYWKSEAEHWRRSYHSAIVQ
jgi:hypothetical protein|tara:strand:+ start:374 stop:634 length:261 start_codon:yes stop_codon:yes gene_type:complete